ncbi:hypothetical protein BofuT4_uP053990.1 [Botrytis cinerea T4]|uniref:Uncharacterized protein n=1 Tax=Botryotinia fuckeliana (strain T4) TaxID=999810 RepID=G2XVH8_BOTF4|nr:hypothetical protein BofuT4_uP053990.1 [Botrytis cinerea T4]
MSDSEQQIIILRLSENHCSPLFIYYMPRTGENIGAWHFLQISLCNNG